MKFIAKTLYGLENVLAGELKMLGAAGLKIANRAVLFEGNRELMYRVNYCARTALSVLKLVDGFMISSGEDLYRKSSAINWSSFLDPDTTFSVVSVVNSKLFTHTAYPGLVVKDAIADHFRKFTGRRPSVNTSDPGILINLHISGQYTDISIDSSGVPLYKRGYRQGNPEAPLNEVLAAGILLLSGWDASVALTDPMCGSGTIPVEAGMMACRIPPGKFRKEFAFMKWNDFDASLFRKVKDVSDGMIRKPPVRISASDISEKAVKQSFINIANAGLADSISIEVSDFRDLRPAGKEGFLVMNPPYGGRLKPGDLKELYSMIGTTLKHSYPGFRAWIITPGRELLADIGLKPRSKQVLFNGSLECILAEFELYAGTMKHRRAVKSS